MPHPSLADVFPEQPEEYAWLDHEPVFDPARHLQLEKPDQSWSLGDLGYGEAFIEKQASQTAMFSTARLLSEEGVAALQETARLLEPHVHQVPDGHRATGYLRGTVFISKFIRDLCRSDDVTEFGSELFGTPLVPHTMVYQQGHMNFAPRDIAKPVDGWHHDFVGFDYVLMCHDPAGYRGGDFRYFLGTREEGHAIVSRGETIPEDRVVTPHFPGAGYACFMQGSAVYHCASPLQERAERVSLVNAYVSLDVTKPDPTRTFFITPEGPYSWIDEVPETRHSFAEYTRHTAWLAREKLSHLLREHPFDADRESSLEALRQAVRDIERAIETMELGPQHFEKMEELRRKQDAELLS
ncbi:MAG: hypothetical protein P8Q36_10865 [Alphaproteobacteria bacterium]|jgi:hypothetical protein|nr:hypothetical protein [Rhodospirillaceae bacterium]MBT6202475.1 hypothetical protein [Rhodospirillaceae bacterium]MBT7615448.1 hypothetical protein [Rhodospirillaceae bacterium]MDG2481350.1 hypothetical protein [Alphaproteobacteria bacterium]